MYDLREYTTSMHVQKQVGNGLHSMKPIVKITVGLPEKYNAAVGIGYPSIIGLVEQNYITIKLETKF